MQSTQFGHRHTHPFPVTPRKCTIDWADLVSDDSGAEVDLCDDESCVETGSTHAASCSCSPSGSSSTPSAWSRGSFTAVDAKGCASLPSMAESLVQQLKAFEVLASEAAVDQASTKVVKSDVACNTELLSDAVENAKAVSAKLSAQESHASELRASVSTALQQAKELEAKRDAAVIQMQALSTEAQESAALASTTVVEVAELKAKLQEVQKELLSRGACIAKQSTTEVTQDREAELKALRDNILLANHATEEFQEACANAHAALLNIKQRRKRCSEVVAPDTDQMGADTSALQQQLREIRAELDAPRAAGLRIKTLEKRMGEIGLQNEALKSSLSAESTLNDLASIPNKIHDGVSQNRNKELLAKVQKLRTLRDSDQATCETLQNEVAVQKAMCAAETREMESLAVQVCQARVDAEIAQQEMHDQAAQVERLEQKVQEASGYVTQLSSQHRAISSEIEAIRKAQKQSECKETILEWKLKKAILQLQQQPHISSAARRLGRHLVKPLGTLSRTTLKSKIAAKIPETGEDSDAASSCCTSTTCEAQSEGGPVLGSLGFSSD